MITQISTKEYQISKIKVEGKIIICVYRSPNKNNAQDFINHLTNLIQNNHSPTIMCGDFNLTTLPQNFQESILHFNFIQTIKESTHDRGNIVDAFFIRNVEVNDQFQHFVHFSDHNVICTNIKIN